MDIAVDGTEGKRFAVYAAIMSSCRQWSFVVSLIYLCVLDVRKLRENYASQLGKPKENLWSIAFLNNKYK